MCMYCGGNLKESTTEFLEKQDNFIIVVKNVPCTECTQCGETYFSNDVTKQLEKILDSIKIITSEITVTVIDYSNQVA